MNVDKEKENKQDSIPTEWALSPQPGKASAATVAVQVVKVCIPANWPGGSHEHR